MHTCEIKRTYVRRYTYMFIFIVILMVITIQRINNKNNHQYIFHGLITTRTPSSYFTRLNISEVVFCMHLTCESCKTDKGTFLFYAFTLCNHKIRFHDCYELIIYLNILSCSRTYMYTYMLNTDVYIYIYTY